MPEEKNTFRPALIAAGTAIGTAAAVYAFVIRPRILRWGATDSDTQRQLPGDAIVINPAVQSDRVVTIQASPDQIWPWLVQIGYGRGGWYSYDAVEEAIGAGEFVDGHSANRIVPELQELAVGDVIRMTDDTYFTVVELEPDRYMLLRMRTHPFSGQAYDLYGHAPEGPYLEATWLFHLADQADGYTRLHARLRADFKPRIPLQLLGAVTIDPAHFAMERKMLLGIKQRAEAYHDRHLLSPAPSR